MKKVKAAFIAHPLNLSTLSVITGWPQPILASIGMNRIKKYIARKRPFIFNELTGIRSKTGTQIDLIGVACPLMPDQMASLGTDFVLGRIVESAKLAQKKGADIVILGGFTSVIGNEGEDVARAVHIPVTSGNTFTAGLAIQGIETAMKMTRLKNIDKFAIIGATGDIGSACANYFSDKTNHLACVARDQEKLLKLAEKIASSHSTKVSCHRKVSEAVTGADVIISATSALTTIIDIDALKPRAIVCDVALPANIAREVARKRNDVLVFEGGLSKVPFNDQIVDMKWRTLMPSNAVYGCLAEGLVLAFEGLLENFSIGRGNISQDKITLIMELAKKHGFDLSDFFCGDKFYSDADLKFIAQHANDDSPSIQIQERLVAYDRA